MDRSELEHAIRAACDIIKRNEVIVVGSQAILGTYYESELPAEATASQEVDILPFSDDDEADAEIADLLDGVAGEFSMFDETHGFSIDGVDLRTTTLPNGWRDRLIKVKNQNTASLNSTFQFTGWCLEKHDLCVAKLCAWREKDLAFVSALIEAGLVSAKTIAKRLKHVPEEKQIAVERALKWIEPRI